MKTSKKLKKITIPVQKILCFSARNINSTLIQVISLFQHSRILFHEKKKIFHFYPFDMLCTFCGACISVPIQL